jgi:protein SCO1/2
MRKRPLNYLAIVVSTLLGVLLIYFGTDGLHAFTAESARIHRLMEEKPTFPDVTLEDSKERVYSISEFEGKYVMATFIYTACTDVCPKLEMNLAAVYDQIPEEYIEEDIVFLSISFDPDRDDPETLDTYRQAFGSDGETWRMARVTDKEELNALLDEFGVIVIPDGAGGFAHNSAFYFVDPEGELLDVMDYEQVDLAAEKVIEELRTSRME